MPYTLPDFNLFMDWWDHPDVPVTDPASIEDIPCQLYRNSRGGDTNTPRAQIRISVDWVGILIMPTTSGAAGNPCVECPKGSGAYYRIDRGEWVHRGFPNEYLTCDATPCTIPGKTAVDSDTDLS